MLNRGGKKREALIEDVASSRASLAFQGKRSDSDGLGNNSPSLDSSQTEWKTKAKSKQNATQSASLSTGNGSNKRESESLLPGNPPRELEKPVTDSGHNNDIPLTEFDQDLNSFLNFEEDDDLMDCDFNGLEIPTDDLTDLAMLM